MGLFAYLKKNRIKILKILITIVVLYFLVCIILQMFTILFSDTVSLILKIDNIMPIFIMEGLVIIIKPFIKLLAEYFRNQGKNVVHYSMEMNIQ